MTRELTIDRSRWLRGEGDSRSVLHRPSDGKMCCLGFYLEACGIPRERLTGRSTPGSILTKDQAPEEAKWLFQKDDDRGSYHSGACIDLMRTNDATRSERQREEIIAEEFAFHGVNVTFVDGTPVPPIGTEKS